MRLRLPWFNTRTEVVSVAQQRVDTVKGLTSCDYIPLTTDESTFMVTNVTILNKITVPVPHEKLLDIVLDDIVTYN